MDDEGEPLLNGPQFKFDELDPNPDVEYDTLKDAIQLGLEVFAEQKVNWKVLFDLIIK